ncbi:hypothetical protein ACWD04_07725 [Streptomyces sp. NPDC002911]
MPRPPPASRFNRAIAPVGSGADFVVSGKLVGLLMSQNSQDRNLAGLFEELLAPGGNTIQLKPAVHHVSGGAPRRRRRRVGFAPREGCHRIPAL